MENPFAKILDALEQKAAKCQKVRRARRANRISYKLFLRQMTEVGRDKLLIKLTDPVTDIQHAREVAKIMRVDDPSGIMPELRWMQHNGLLVMHGPENPPDLDSIIIPTVPALHLRTLLLHQK